MPPAEPAILEARGLVKRFGASPVLRGVDLAVARGQVLVILGENGSGKTTLLRIMAGLARPTTGEMFLEGKPFHSSDVAARRRLGFLSHRSHMYDELSLRENLHFAARLFGLKDEPAVVSRAIELARLEEKSNERIGRLSRGMQQRAALARAFLHRPEILLLDEPFTALDTASADRVRQWIGDRVAEHCAVVIVTHQPESIWDLATRVGVLAGGRWALLENRPADLGGFLTRYREAIRV
jgi:heme ABC exporter ATP-binding subunit CcmA